MDEEMRMRAEPEPQEEVVEDVPVEVIDDSAEASDEMATVPLKETTEPVDGHGSRLQKRNREKRVKLYTLHYDEHRGRYLQTIDRIPESALPEDAVHVTGEKGAWLLDRTEAGAFPESGTCTAIDLNLYMVNNSINDALATNWNGARSMDMRRMLTYGIVAIIGVCIVWAMWPH